MVSTQNKLLQKYSNLEAKINKKAFHSNVSHPLTGGGMDYIVNKFEHVRGGSIPCMVRPQGGRGGGGLCMARSPD